MSIVRTQDYDAVGNILETYRDIIGGFDLGPWLSDDNNLAFIDDTGNLGLLEYDTPGVYNSHMFFCSRGRDAINKATEMIGNAFEHYPVQVMRGYTDVSNRAARWMDRQLGYTSYGVLSTLNPPCELFILTKKEFEVKHGKSTRE